MLKRALCLALVTASFAASAGGGDVAAPSGQAAVEAEPALQVPSADYRREWVELGTYAVLADNPADGAKKMHFVYTERTNLEAYLKTGSFPDCTVLVKDVFAGKTGTPARSAMPETFLAASCSSGTARMRRRAHRHAAATVGVGPIMKPPRRR
jgi:hypothetical protein